MAIKNIEMEFVGKSIVEQLNLQLPFREIAGFNRFPQISAVKIWIGAINLNRFVPDHRLQAKLGLPVKFDKGRLLLRHL